MGIRKWGYLCIAVLCIAVFSYLYINPLILQKTAVQADVTQFVQPFNTGGEATEFDLSAVCDLDKLAAASATAPLLLVAGVAADSFAGKYLSLLYNEAFKRLGRRFEYRYYPFARSSLMSRADCTDGEMARLSRYELGNLNLIRVPEPIYQVNVVAIAAKSDIHIDGWKSLTNHAYIVNYGRGNYVAEQVLPTLLPSTQFMAVNNHRSGFYKLLVGRADLYIGVDAVLEPILKSDEFNNMPLYIAGTLEAESAHLFLNKRHLKLVPKISAILHQMKQEGLFALYHRQARQAYGLE